MSNPRVLAPLLPALLLAIACGEDENERSDINVWRVDCDRGTLSLQLTDRELLLAATNIAFTEADCTPSSGASCSLDYRASPQYTTTLGTDGSFELSEGGIAITGSLDRSTETGAGTLTVDHATGACSCSFSGSWTAVLSCTDMGTECIGASDCPDGETCQCGRCAPTG